MICRYCLRHDYLYNLAFSTSAISHRRDSSVTIEWRRKIINASIVTITNLAFSTDSHLSLMHRPQTFHHNRSVSRNIDAMPQAATSSNHISSLIGSQ